MGESSNTSHVFDKDFRYTIRLLAPPIESGQLISVALIVPTPTSRFHLGQFNSMPVLLDKTDLIVVLESRQSEID